MLVANPLSQVSLSCGSRMQGLPWSWIREVSDLASSCWAWITNCKLGCLVCLLGFQSAEPDRQVLCWFILKPWVSSDSKADLEVSWTPSSLPKTSLWSKFQIQFWLVIVRSGCRHAHVENTEQNRCSSVFCFLKSTWSRRFCHGCCVTQFTAGDTEAACVGLYQTDSFSVLLGIWKSSGKPWICIGFQKESSKETLFSCLLLNTVLSPSPFFALTNLTKEVTAFIFKFAQMLLLADMSVWMFAFIMLFFKKWSGSSPSRHHQIGVA